ncbi:hypothetical protein PQX77_014126 [Marasmius sp. AFHP31]|nr:hypothetical protein PQX77_014126 [Marasmius sp. AFHP31]
MSYAELWITPQGEPLGVDAAVSFMKYLSNEELQYGRRTVWCREFKDQWGSGVSTVFVRRNTLFTRQLYASSSDLRIMKGIVNGIVGSTPSDWEYNVNTDYIDDQVDNWQKLYYGNHYDKIKCVKSLSASVKEKICGSVTHQADVWLF